VLRSEYSTRFYRAWAFNIHSARIHMPQSSSRDALHEIVLTRTNIIYIHVINVLEKTAWILKKKTAAIQVYAVRVARMTD